MPFRGVPPRAELINAPIIPALWDVATATAVTVSGGGTIATHSGTTGNDGIKVTLASAKDRGKWYWEITVGTWASASGSNMGYGFCNTGTTFSGMGPAWAGGCGMYKSSNYWANGSNVGTFSRSIVTGDVMACALDLSNGVTNALYWTKFLITPTNWNNTAGSDPATGVSAFGTGALAGPLVPCVMFGGTGGVANDAFTINCGGSAFTGTVPSGYQPWRA